MNVEGVTIEATREAQIFKLLSAQNAAILLQHVHNDRLRLAQNFPVVKWTDGAYVAGFDTAPTGLRTQLEQDALRRRKALSAMVSRYACPKFADVNVAGGGEDFLDLV